MSGPFFYTFASRAIVHYGPLIDIVENAMKKTLILIAVAVLLVAAGCKTNPQAIIDLPLGPEYVGEYLDVTDVRHIGYALDAAPDRTPVQWENPATGYQFSMMVFSANRADGVTSRKFTVLSIEPSGDAEVLNLIGESSKKKEWTIVAEGPASFVGKAARMPLGDTPAPAGKVNSGQNFKGFIVSE